MYVYQSIRLCAQIVYGVLDKDCAMCLCNKGMCFINQFVRFQEQLIIFRDLIKYVICRRQKNTNGRLWYMYILYTEHFVQNNEILSNSRYFQKLSKNYLVQKE